MLTNYHSHSTFCDGKSTMEEMVISAVECGFTHWGVSSHAPFPISNDFALKEEDIPAYKREFLRLKDKYADKIKLYIGLEMDFVPDICEDIRHKAVDYGLDYFIGSVHQVKEHNNSLKTWFIDGGKSEKYDLGLKEVFDNDIKSGVTCFFNQQKEMIEHNRPDVLGHFDKVVMHNKDRYFLQSEKWYEDLVLSLIDTVAKCGTVVEINTRGLYKQRHNDYYPSTFWIKYLIEHNIPLTVSTDCHKADEAGAYYKEALRHLKELNCKELYYFEQGWHAEDINAFVTK
ncbi:MAG: histidinol-phosphatase [Bacteroidales bacterium]|nr:histidinol-phosphatase [Bacteroidales bacterium]MBP3254749.1 histidinol-phosphatase [Bacteroidales bacterium]